jgi:hypothetical protein
VRLQVGRVDHHCLRNGNLGGQPEPSGVVTLCRGMGWRIAVFRVRA